MDAVREAAVAGLFYPSDPKELRGLVERLLAEGLDPGRPVPKGVIAPHAGYVYSGPTAAVAYRALAPDRDRIRRIVLLGPAHRFPFEGLAAAHADAFATPLGRVPVDAEGIRDALALPQVSVLDAAHAGEHSLEVHLPFLQVLLGMFSLVPLVVGDASPDEVAEVLDRLWGGPETRIVVSSDLSHDLDGETARWVDVDTTRAIEALDPDRIGPDRACGCRPIGGLLTAAARRGMSVRTADLRNSGDTAGPKNRVVGYGTYLFAEPEAV